ncbi:hypothetical protein AB1Y20_015266 [Prymnesium parvum]|uniref:Uncharacterized protein n=1 Tax=Prymnesium parvum TaxID=97485 RepID=A0AB34JZX8_PRYPA
MASCASAKAGDFKHEACSTFCKEAHRTTHCAFCKCKECTFCQASTNHTRNPTGTRAPPTPAASLQQPAPSHSKHATRQSDGPHHEEADPFEAVLARDASSTAALAAAASTHQMELQRLQASLHSAEERARAAEARASGMEKQLSLCRHSSATLRATMKHHNAPPPPLMAAGQIVHLNGSHAEIQGRQVGIRCADSVSWAAQEGVRLYPELYPGLNVNSSVFDFQLHLHLYDPTISRCPDPRGNGAPINSESEGWLASILLLIGVLACALANAYGLGYLQPSQTVRRLLRAIGCPQNALVR